MSGAGLLRELVLAFGLVLALEGILLAGFTERMKRRMIEMAKADSGLLRNVGLGTAALGVALVWAARALT